VKGKLRRNKRKAFTFVPFAAHYFCIISSNFTERAGVSFRAAFFGSFLGGTRNEQNQNFCYILSFKKNNVYKHLNNSIFTIVKHE